MDFLTFAIINGPLATFNIMFYVFYVFCMLYPPHGERIKQPIKLLLGSVIFCKVTYLFSALLLFCVDVTAENLYLVLTFSVMFAWGLCTGMSSFVWLNFFYCTQIVPSQRALFIWIKKNITHILYCVWLLDRTYGFLSVGVMVMDYLTIADLLCFSHNFTAHTDSVCIQIPHSVSQSCVFKIAPYVVQASFFLHVCIMMLSNSSVVIYLVKHTYHMITNGQSLSCPHFKGHVRVSVTNILQGVLFLFCAMSTVYKTYVPMVLEASLTPYGYFTVINFYAAGSSFTLGVAQSVFRRRFESIWLRVTQVMSAAPVLPR